MKPSDVVPYLTAIRGNAWLSGQEVPEDGRTPTPTQLLNLPAQPAIIGANILCGDADDYSYDAAVQAILTKHANAGGIVSLCWHPPNFFTGAQNISSAWVANQTATKPDLSPLTSTSSTSTAKAAYLRAVSRAIAYIRVLPATAPVIFRPWHEANNDWSWWGHDEIYPARSEAGIRALWADTITRVKTACPNVLSGWSPGLSWYADMLYGYPKTLVPDIVGCSLYSNTMDFANSGDYGKLVGTGRPMLLFEVGNASGASGWPAGNILTALTTRYPQFSGWVSWQDGFSLLEMSGSAAVLADPRVINRDRLPAPTPAPPAPQPVGYVYAASDPGVQLYDSATSTATLRLPIWNGGV